MEQLSDSPQADETFDEALDIETDDSPEEVRKQLDQMFSGHEKQFRKDRPLLWKATLLAPLVLSLLILAIASIIHGPNTAFKLVSHALFTFFVAGRFVLLAGVEGEAAEKFSKIAMSPGELFWLVTYLDFIVALFVTFHMGVLFRIPKVGPRLAMLVWDGKFFMDSAPWIKRMAFAGLVGFVIFPSSTTGSIGGSIFGRVLGLSRWATIGGVLLGSLLGNAIMYAFAKQINYLVKDNWSIRIGGVVLLLLMGVFINWRYQKVKSKYMESQGVAEKAS